MAPTKKQPPKFQHLPRDRAKRLKSSWVHAQKIKSKWRAEKRKHGLPSTSQSEQADNKEPAGSDGAGSEEISESEPSGEQVADNSKNAARTSLRELTKKAYASSSLHNYKSESDILHRRRGGSSVERSRRGLGRGRGRGGQPNMKLRMNAMLEKIKQDLT